MSSNVSYLSGRYKIIDRNTKNILQWKVIVQFDPVISLHPEYDSGYGMMSNPISYSYFSQSYMMIRLIKY